MSGDGSSDLPSAASGVPAGSSSPGTAFGRYRVLHKIGMGSLGPVFRGEDSTTLEPVAIKQIQLTIGPERTRLIADELEELVRAVPPHPHLARLLAAGVSDGVVTLVSSWAAGEGLDAALGAYGPAAISDATDRLSHIADALDRAAERGIWHGALHPADVIVSATDTHVTGVGVAQVLEKAHVQHAVRAPYTAPEVIGARKSSRHADQFALAAMAYEWLFGSPIAGPAEWAMDVPRLPDVNHAALGGAFTTALAPEPSDRFATCAAFVEALRAAAATATAARPASAASLVQGDLLDEPTLVVASSPPEVDDLPIVEPLAPVALPPAEVPEATVVRAGSTRADSRDRAPVVDHEKAVAWRGEMAALSAGAPREDDRRGLSATALVAVFIVGLALGGAGGYVVAQRRAAAAPAQRASTAAATEPTAVAETPSADRTIDPVRTATETPVSATSPPASAPVAANTESARPGPDATGPATPVPPARDAAAARTARLLVRSTPGGATVTVDGVARGTTPLVLRDLPIGVRSVTITRRGYAPAERSISLSGDRPSRSIQVTLAPIAGTAAPARPAPATSGSLVVESRPSGATVTLDGKPAGATPLTIASVAPGRHTVVITAPGMKPVTSTVIVKAGERARVAATLVGGQQD